MPDIRMVFWRAVTAADFFNIERSREAGPAGGGGQSYLSISFRGLEHEHLARFLGVDPLSVLANDRPEISLPSVGVIDDPDTRAPLTFSARYRPPNTDARYRINTQNRQYQTRHPAWIGSRGFPEAPDDVRTRWDPRMPDLSLLKVCVLRTDEDDYLAGFTNTDLRPPSLPTSLNRLFEPYQSSHSAGVITLDPGALDLDVWQQSIEELAGAAEILSTKAPEVAEAREHTKMAAGKRPSGQGRKIDPVERRAIELRAMDVATEHLEREGWVVDDVSHYRPYDLHCTRGSTDLRVEVKGTTGDGSTVLLTPGEVVHARRHESEMALLVVSGIAILRNDDGEPRAHDGRLEVTLPWRIDSHGELRPTGFEYVRMLDGA